MYPTMFHLSAKRCHDKEITNAMMPEIKPLMVDLTTEEITDVRGGMTPADESLLVGSSYADYGVGIGAEYAKFGTQIGQGWTSFGLFAAQLFAFPGLARR
jgi:hypothetical protein